MMNKKSILAFLTICMFISVSCKRNDVFGDVEPNTNRVIAEFTDAGTGTYVSHDFSAEPIEISLTELRLNPRSVTNHITKVSVIVNPAVVSNYNFDNGTTYTAAQTGTFSLVEYEYLLKADQRKVMIRAVLRPQTFLDRQYAIGLSIAKMSDGDISPVSHDVIVFVSIKNDYDGIYSLKGYSNIPASPYVGSFVLPCSEELEVATASANSVFINPTQPVANAGSFAYISNLLPEIVFNKSTNKVSNVNARTGSVGFIFPYDASFDSRYDPASKTIFLKYGIAPVGSGRYIIDTFVYCKPR